MPPITLRVLDGADRGRVFHNLATPITIGREEGNTIQLNDERVSRFHLKIQDDHEKLVLTDLESTNGTKVNGEEVQLRILRLGDMISVGRSVMLLGNREELSDPAIGSNGHSHGEEEGTVDPEGYAKKVRGQSLDFDLNIAAGKERGSNDLPDLPERLSPGQAAQLCELLEYLHGRLRPLLASVQAEKRADRVTLDFAQWQHLLDVQARLSEYLRLIAEPEE